MGILSGFGLFVACIVLSASLAFASVSSIPSSVSLSASEPLTISFALYNDSSVARSPSTQLLAPVGYFFTGIPSSMASRESKVVSLTLQPNPDLSGQEFQSLVRIHWSDGSLESVPLKIRFSESVAKPVQKTASPSNALSGFFSLSSLSKWTALDALLAIAFVVMLIAVLVRVRNRFFSKKRESWK